MSLAKLFLLISSVTVSQLVDGLDLTVAGFLPYPATGLGGFGIVQEADSVDNVSSGSYEAVGQLAIHHFNTRDSTVVKEISTLPETCTLEFEATSHLVLDSETVKAAVKRMWGLINHPNPKAILGPTSLEIMTSLEPIADTFNIPIFDHFFESNYPNCVTMTLTRMHRAKAMVDYLRRPLQKRQGIAVAYQEQTREAEFAVDLESVGRSNNLDVTLFPVTGPSHVADVLAEIKASNINTVYLGFDENTDLAELARLMDVAGILTEEYVFIISHESYESNKMSTDDSVLDLFRGSIVFDRIDSYELTPNKQDPYLKSWRDAYGKGDNEYPASGASFVYDSIIAMGFALCQDRNSLLNGLMQTRFNGASGVVRFESTSEQAIVRDQAPIMVGAFNIRVKKNHDLQSNERSYLHRELTGLYSTLSGWHPVEGSKDIYRSGLPFAPLSSRLWKPTSMEESGLIGCIVVSLLCIATGFLVFVYRKEAALRRTQPLYLCMICVGAMLSGGSFSPSPSIFDKPDQISFICMSLPWLFILGMLITSSALFTKAWRVYQATKQNRIHRPNGFPVFIAPLVIGCILLLVWTIFDPLTWDGSENSTRVCTSKHDTVFISFSAFIVLYMEAFTLLFAWRTMNASIPTDFQDNGAIIACQFIRLYTFFLGSMSYFFGMSNQSGTDAFFIWQLVLNLIISLAPLLIIVLPRLARGINSRLLSSESLFKNALKVRDIAAVDGDTRDTNTSSSFRHLLPMSVDEASDYIKDSYLGKD